MKKFSCSSYDPQTAVSVIEAHPDKKIKIEKVGNGDNGLYQASVAVTHAQVVSSRKSRKAIPKPAAGGSRLKSTKSDLPPQLQDDPEDKWSNIVLPSLLLWCGDQANVWTISDSDLAHVLVAIIHHVYPSFNLTQSDVNHGSPIYKLVCFPPVFY